MMTIAIEELWFRDVKQEETEVIIRHIVTVEDSDNLNSLINFEVAV